MKTSAKKTIEAAIDEVVALARRVVPPKMTAAVLYQQGLPKLVFAIGVAPPRPLSTPSAMNGRAAPGL